MADGWQWAATALAREAPKIKLLDTVLLDASAKDGIASWLYTNKNGQLSKKKKEAQSWRKISARFARFALAHPANASGARLVATALTRAGARTALDEAALAALVDPVVERGDTTGLAAYAALQCYLRPSGGDASDGGAARAAVDGGGAARAAGRGADDPATAARLCDAARALAACLGDACRASFTLDDNGELWLSDVRRAAPPAAGSPPRASPGGGDPITPLPVIPAVRPASEGAESFAPSTDRRSQSAGSGEANPPRSAAAAMEAALNGEFPPNGDDDDGQENVAPSARAAASGPAQSRRAAKKESAALGRLAARYGGGAGGPRAAKPGKKRGRQGGAKQQRGPGGGGGPKPGPGGGGVDADVIARFAVERERLRAEQADAAPPSREASRPVVAHMSQSERPHLAQAASLPAFPPMHGAAAMTVDERTLAALEREADSRVNDFNPGTTAASAAPSGRPPPLSMSRSEAEFMQRAEQHSAVSALPMHGATTVGGGLGGQSVFGGFGAAQLAMGEAPSVVSLADVADGGQGAAAKLAIDALRARIAKLEGERSSLGRRLALAEEGRAAAQRKAKEIARAMAGKQNDWASAMREKDDAHSSHLLELEAAKTAAMSQMEGATVANAAMAQSERAEALRLGTPAHESSSTDASALARRNRDLLRSLEQKEQHLSTATRKWSDERQRLMADQARLLTEEANRSREDLSNARDAREALEDKLSASDTGKAAALAQLDVERARAEEKAREAARAARQRDDAVHKLKAMQQSYESAASFEVAANQQHLGDGSAGGAIGANAATLGPGGVLRDGESALAALQATSEARIRQLNNKVEFLKASLASEAHAKEELHNAMERLKSRLDEHRTEGRRVAVEGERKVADAVSATEARVKSQAEGAAAEASALQAKLAHAQAQLADALHDLGVAKRREELAKQDAARLSAGAGERDAAMDEMRGALEDARERAERADEEAAARVATEALVRRLENERTYLKSQLTSEVTLKSELQSALEAATRTLAELKESARVDRDDLGADREADAALRDSRESALRTAVAEAQATVTQLSGQLHQLKAAYTKTRDQLRLEQSAAATARSTQAAMGRRLEQALDDARESRAAHDGAVARQAEDLKATNHSMEALRLDAVAEKRRLGEEIKGALRRLAECQQRELEGRRAVAAAAQFGKKQAAGQRIWDALVAIQNGPVGHAFSKWRRMSEAADAADYERNLTASAVAAGVAAAEAAAEAELHARVARAGRDAAAGLVAAHEAAARDASDAQAEAARRQAAALDRADGEAAARLAAAEVAVREELTAAMERREIERDEELRAAVTRLAIEKGDAVTAAERAAEGERDAADGRHRESLAAAAEVAARSTSAAVQAKAAEMKQALAEAKLAHELALADAADKAVEMRDAALADYADDAALERDAAVARASAAAAAEAAEAAEAEAAAAEERVTVAVAAAEAAAKDTADAALAAAAASLNELEKSGSAETRAAVAAAISAETDKRQRAVRLEMSKWQKTVRELEQRHEAEAAAAWRRGMEERDALAGSESAQLKGAAERALAEVKAKAKGALEAQRRDAEKSLAAVKAESERAVAAAAQAAEDATRAACDRDRDDKLAALEAGLVADREVALARALEAAAASDQASVAEAGRLRTEWAADRERFEKELAGLCLQVERFKNEAARAAADGEAAADASDSRAAGLARALRDAKEAAELARDKAERDAAYAAKEARRAQAAAVAKEAEDRERATALAVEALREESDRLIEQLEAALGELKDEKGAAEGELDRTRHEMEECQDTIYDLQTEVAETKKGRAFRLFAINVSASKAKERTDAEKEAIQASADEAVSAVRKDGAARQRALGIEVASLGEALDDADAMRREMHATLVSHKREALIEHKASSAQLQGELEELARQRDAVERDREAVLDAIAGTEDMVRQLEAAIHAHSRSSALADGRLNVAHAKKKKRLDDEYERTLEELELKRTTLARLDERLRDLSDERTEKEDSMKALERQLVELLVQQQKRLLAILTSAARRAPTKGGGVNANPQLREEGDSRDAVG